MAPIKKEYKFLMVGIFLGIVLCLLFFYMRNGTPALLPLTSIFSKPTAGNKQPEAGVNTATPNKNILFVNTNSLNLRECAGTDCRIIASLLYSTRVTKLSLPEEHDRQFWIQVQPEAGGMPGWADQRYFSESITGSTSPGGIPTNISGGGIAAVNNNNGLNGIYSGTGLYQIKGNNVNARRCPDLKCGVIFILYDGQPVTYLDRREVGDSFNWVRVRAQGREGWVWGYHVARM